MPEPGAPATFTERRAEPRAASPRPPLLVLLHGIGADENDLFPLAGAVDPRFRVVSLRAPYDYVMGYSWFQIDFLSDGTVKPHVEQAKASLARLLAWIEAAPARLETDPSRTYLLGFSQGAMMSLGVLQRRPDLLAGVVALSGRDPHGLFEMTADRDAVGRVPLFVAHGTHDDILPVEHGRRTRTVFSELSEDFTYEEYPVAHGVSEQEMRSVATWLGQRLDGQSPSGS